MNETAMFDKICRAMSDPQFYPHEVSCLERRETHISVVFLTGKYVYKLKKPKDLGFLNFKRLADRKYFCEQEIMLNQRLSKGVYLELVDIFEDDHSRITLSNKGGTVVEYAVKMMQLPEDRNLKTLLEKRLITADLIKSLGEMLSAFYKNAERSDAIDSFGDPKVLQYNIEENFRQIQSYAEELLDTEKWDFIRQVSLSFLKNHTDLFHYRVEKGRIRDGHGDLRTDHVYFHSGIQVIDCIEFNERFRYGDTGLDLAFLRMDLDHLKYPDMGYHLISVYAKISKDPVIYALLDFYAAYRALVRLKVTCLSLDQTDEKDQAPVISDIRRYLKQVYQYAVLFSRPTLWVFFGLPASGKSTLARKIADALFLPLFQSDVTRKEFLSDDDQNVVPYNTGIYRSEMRSHVYSQLMNLAQEALKKGKSVALDATFSSEKWRQEAIRLADDMDAALIFVQCVCREETIKTRLAKRENTPGESDARLMHFEDMINNTEPFRADDSNIYMKIDTDLPADHNFYEALSDAYALKCAQVKALLKTL